MSHADIIDRLETLNSCLDAIAMLMIPASDLVVVDRDKLTMLLTFIAEEQAITLQHLSQAA